MQFSIDVYEGSCTSDKQSFVIAIKFKAVLPVIIIAVFKTGNKLVSENLEIQ